LIKEKSPYLIQHANNPVDWYPWGEEALDRASMEDKPIFLSIGYSTCHWCHVMERESFEDDEIASLLNDGFISIKVDREERPDIDATYMDVCQMMTGSGGWPLTIIMRPDRKPFFAGTYLPKNERFGMMGIVQLLTEIDRAWKERREEVDDVAEKATATIIQRLSVGGESRSLDHRTLERGFRQLEDDFDDQWGGFGTAPKFPLPHRLLFLLRYWKRTGEERALRMVERTLTSMAMGGINDHVGGGFHRYSTDRTWLLPHFEKMLYDQALLTMAYSDAFLATGNPLFSRTASDIIDYVLRDMISPHGGFCSAEDADSEGEEGRFYLWTLDEIGQVLGDDAYLIIDGFNIKEEGNFRDESTREMSGKNILHRCDAPGGPREDVGNGGLQDKIDASLKRLKKARESRVRPLRDDKVMTDWNGLMIATLARASWILDREDCLQAAEDSARFLIDTVGKDGIRHRSREGDTSEEVFLQDHSFLIWGLLELYKASFDPHWLRDALRLADEMIRMFWDDERGWFRLSPIEGENMIFQKMEAYDGAIPSGNSAAFMDMILLSRLTDRNDLEAIAVRLAESLSFQVEEMPLAHTLFLCGLDQEIGPSSEVVIVCDREDNEMIKAIRKRYLPNTIPLMKREGLEELVPFVEEMSSGEGCMAYVCKGRSCERPTGSIEEMLDTLDRMT
jgi:hypothetical protein